MRVSLRARQTAAVTVLIAVAMSVLSLQHLAQRLRPAGRGPDVEGQASGDVDGKGLERVRELDPAAADPGMIRGVDRDGRGGVDAGSSLVRRLTVHSDLPGKDQGAGAFT